MPEKKLIGKVHGYEVYVTKSFGENLKKLNLTPEEEKELTDKILRQFARRFGDAET